MPARRSAELRRGCPIGTGVAGKRSTTSSPRRFAQATLPEVVACPDFRSSNRHRGRVSVAYQKGEPLPRSESSLRRGRAQSMRRSYLSTRPGAITVGKGVSGRTSSSTSRVSKRSRITIGFHRRHLAGGCRDPGPRTTTHRGDPRRRGFRVELEWCTVQGQVWHTARRAPRASTAQRLRRRTGWSPGELTETSAWLLRRRSRENLRHGFGSGAMAHKLGTAGA